MPTQNCNQCGNKHYGPCATEETCFIWQPSQKCIPNQVWIVGSWRKWQTADKLTKQVSPDGHVFFKIIQTLSTGQYEYKYIVDGEWRCNQKRALKPNSFGGYNNFIKVFPKKVFIPVNKKGLIKISSGIIIEGIKLIGSWDNWKKQIDMQCWKNNLRDFEIDRDYEFKFKLKKQYLIDEKFPTVINSFGTLNNIIITYSESQFGVISNSSETQTPTKKWPITRKKQLRSFEWVQIDKEVDIPYDKVEGHSMCNVGEFIYLFGGFSRCEFYNSLTKLSTALTQSTSQEALPNGRAFHNMVTYGNKIIIFGGNNKNVLQDYYSFNVSEEKWSMVPIISGKYPIKKQKKTCVLYGDLMVFFGGYTLFQEQEVFCSDISVLDIENMKWIDLIEVQGELPQGRCAHSACLIDSDMYIFGGTFNITQNLNLNDLWKINLEKVANLVWKEVKPRGRPPSPRHGHTMNNLNGSLVIFGGQNDNHIELNDVFIFSEKQNQWVQPIISGSIPRPKYNHAATVIHSDQLIVFGGRKIKRQQKKIYILKPSFQKIALDIEELYDE